MTHINITVLCRQFAFGKVKSAKVRSNAYTLVAHRRRSDTKHIAEKEIDKSRRPSVAQTVAQSLVAKLAVVGVNIFAFAIRQSRNRQRVVGKPRHVEVFPECRRTHVNHCTEVIAYHIQRKLSLAEILQRFDNYATHKRRHAVCTALSK